MQPKLYLLAFLLLAVFAQDVDIASEAVAESADTPTTERPPNFATMKFAALTENIPANKRISTDAKRALSFSTYTIQLHTYCPNTVWLWVYASGPFTVSTNSSSTVQGWFPGNMWRKIAIQPNCQCTVITVRVFNWNIGVNFISYGLTQNTSGCFKCEQEAGVIDLRRYWNYQTCQCECRRNCCFKRFEYVNKKNCQC